MGSGEGVAGGLARRVALAGLGERALVPDGRNGAAGNDCIRPGRFQRRISSITKGRSSRANCDPDVPPAAELTPDNVTACIPLTGRLSPPIDSRHRVIPDVSLAVGHVQQALDPDLSGVLKLRAAACKRVTHQPPA